jgi:hypothetical protein
MRKPIVFAASAIAMVAMATAGTGVAAADAYAGKTYSEVSSALSSAKLKGVIATRAGDSLDTPDCIVTHSEQAPWIKGDSFAAVTDTVLLFLNCNATVASATTPGNSAASPEGQAALLLAKQQAEQGSATAAANQTSPATETTKGKH